MTSVHLADAEGRITQFNPAAAAAALYQFTDKLYRAETPSDVYQSALDAISRALGCNRASILLFDDAGIMRFAAWRGLSEEYRRAVEGHSPWTRDVKDPQPICIENIETADLSEALKATVKTEGIGAFAFIPLVTKGELIGKFMTYYEAARLFSAAEVDLAVTIARQLGFGVERMRADQQSRLLTSIIANTDDAIVSKDLNGIVTSWNRAAERLYGYAADEIIGKSVTTFIPPERLDEELEIIKQVRRGACEHYDTVRQRKDGTLVDISLTVSAVKDGAGKVVGASTIARDITETKQAQARQDLLAREIQHRTKNIFAVVLAIVARSFAGKQTVEEAESAVVNRLRSLAQTHELLVDRHWEGADILEVVRSEMNPYGGRVHIEGPPLILSAKAAQNFALALHELATNAAKYGALSNATGTIHISWSVSCNGVGECSFLWKEHGGPPVTLPTEKGFGSTVLEYVMGEYFDQPPRMEFARSGLTYSLTASLQAITPTQVAQPSQGDSDWIASEGSRGSVRSDRRG